MDEARNKKTNHCLSRFLNWKITCFLAIKLQAELLNLDKSKYKEISLEKKINDTNSENINLNDQIFKLREENKLLKEENNFINHDISNIQNQIDVIIKLIKKTYEEWINT